LRQERSFHHCEWESLRVLPINPGLTRGTNVVGCSGRRISEHSFRPNGDHDGVGHANGIDSAQPLGLTQ
jgi:hypothetical protein